MLMICGAASAQIDDSKVKLVSKAEFVSWAETLGQWNPDDMAEVTDDPADNRRKYSLFFDGKNGFQKEYTYYFENGNCYRVVVGIDKGKDLGASLKKAYQWRETKEKEGRTYHYFDAEAFTVVMVQVYTNESTEGRDVEFYYFCEISSDTSPSQGGG